jgi:hypothetical protein
MTGDWASRAPGPFTQPLETLESALIAFSVLMFLFFVFLHWALVPVSVSGSVAVLGSINVSRPITVRGSIARSAARIFFFKARLQGQHRDYQQQRSQYQKGLANQFCDIVPMRTGMESAVTTPNATGQLLFAQRRGAFAGWARKNQDLESTSVFKFGEAHHLGFSPFDFKSDHGPSWYAGTNAPRFVPSQAHAPVHRPGNHPTPRGYAGAERSAIR